MASLVFVLVVIALLGWAVTPPTPRNAEHYRNHGPRSPIVVSRGRRTHRYSQRKALCRCGWVGPERRGRWAARRTHTYHVNKAALRSPSAPQIRPAPSFPSIRIPGDRPVKITALAPHASGTGMIEWNIVLVDPARRSEVVPGRYLWEASANGCDVRFLTNNANLQLGVQTMVTEHQIKTWLVDEFGHVWAVGVKDR